MGLLWRLCRLRELIKVFLRLSEVLLERRGQFRRQLPQ